MLLALLSFFNGLYAPTPKITSHWVAAGPGQHLHSASRFSVEMDLRHQGSRPLFTDVRHAAKIFLTSPNSGLTLAEIMTYDHDVRKNESRKKTCKVCAVQPDDTQIRHRHQFQAF